MELLDVASTKKLLDEGATLIDTRDLAEVAEGFIEGAMLLPLDEQFIGTLELLTSAGQRLVVVANEKDVATISRAFKNDGSFHVLGFYCSGLEEWKKAGHKFDMLISVLADELEIDYKYDEFFLLDTRTAEEFAAERIEDAESIPLSDLIVSVVDLETNGLYYIYASNAANAFTAASVCKKYGLERVRVVEADYAQLKETSLPFFSPKKKAEPEKPSEN